MTDDPERPQDPQDEGSQHEGADDQPEETGPLSRIFGRRNRQPVHPADDQADDQPGEPPAVQGYQPPAHPGYQPPPVPPGPYGGAYGGQAGQPGYQPGYQPAGPYGGYRPAYGAPSTVPLATQGSSTDRPARGRVPGWIWPAVAALALVVGLLGGAAGALLVGSNDDNTVGGSVAEGLGGVDTSTAPPIAAGNTSVAAVAAKLLPSTVQIQADYEGQKLGATGSGWVFDKQGHIITNNHVIASAADGGDIEVVDHNGNRSKATLVGRSTVYDLAVLEVPAARRLQPVSLGRSNSMAVGDQVVAIGSPLGLNETVTSGIISAKDRPVTTGDNADDQSYINAVQTDAAINPGNSGGPLVSMQGQVIGVNSAIATTGGSAIGGGESGSIGVGFAIPIEQVITTVDQILKTGKAEYPIIGAKVVSSTSGATSEEGAEIDSVDAGTPAAKAGLEKGDRVTAVDGEPVADGQALIVAIRTHVPGDTITLTYQRGGSAEKARLTLAGKVG